MAVGNALATHGLGGYGFWVLFHPLARNFYLSNFLLPKSNIFGVQNCMVNGKEEGREKRFLGLGLTLQKNCFNVSGEVFVC